MILNSCLLVLYVLLVVCLFVFIFIICCDVAGKRWKGGEGGEGGGPKIFASCSQTRSDPSSTSTAILTPTNKFTNLTLLQILHTDTLIR